MELVQSVVDEICDGATEMRAGSLAARARLEDAIDEFAQNGPYIPLEQLKAEMATRMVPEETKHDQN